MNKQIMHKLKLLAIKSLDTTTGKKFHTVAALFNEHNRMVAIGINSYVKTHPLQKQYAEKVGKPNSQYLHAEIAALVKGKGDKLVVVRINKKGMLMMAKPCSICMLAMKEADIKEVWWSVDENNMESMKII